MRITCIRDDIPSIQLKVFVLALPHVKAPCSYTRDAGEEVLDRTKCIEE